jgi:ribosome-interacting GTPase 1
MPVNAHPEYLQAEKEYHEASSDEERLLALEKMIRFLPKHKGAESLRENIKRRYKKLKQELVKKSKKKKSQKGIKKAELQAVLIGFTNSGKSSILKAITNAHPKIASYGFSTTNPEIGTLNYQDCNIQIIDLPPIASPNFDKSLTNSADTLLIVVEKLIEIPNILESIKNKNAKKIIIFNKIDLHDDSAKRKISETLKSKRYNFVLTSTVTDEGLDELKNKILKSFNMIRVYTRQPKSKEDNVPVVLHPNATLKDVAEKVLHGYSTKVKYAKIWGPSSKFPGQKTGLKHIVKDKDIVEFFTE